MFFLELTSCGSNVNNKKENTLFWYHADQKTNVVNEIKYCDCFFDAMIVFKERFLNSIDDIDILEKKFLDFCFNIGKDWDVFVIFSTECIATCEKAIYNFDFESVIDDKKCLLIVWLI